MTFLTKNIALAIRSFPKQFHFNLGFFLPSPSYTFIHLQLTSKQPSPSYTFIFIDPPLHSPSSTFTLIHIHADKVRGLRAWLACLACLHGLLAWLAAWLSWLAKLAGLSWLTVLSFIQLRLTSFIFIFIHFPPQFSLSHVHCQSHLFNFIQLHLHSPASSFSFKSRG